jgi:transposase
MQPYSKEFRRDVLAACDAQGSTQEVALRFGVSKSWVRRIKQQRRETGQVAPKTKRNRRATWEAWAEWLRAAVAATPDAYLRELKVRLQEERGIEASEELIGRACHVLKLTRKKRPSSPPNKTGTMSPRHVGNGAPINSGSTRTRSSSSTKRGPRPT